ncbi:hypothetical protein BT67DRAFT_424358 [Trichocladium antarcticum]|uniref:HIT-type domain-containing protein n=1 Tax=Trichocladium antarcticum TaxID=1450529 RepID=A0AAN6UHJ6_9PEZI|nr:hypothetical protein BT67DRAFT_424358 [Trichocladium antarcticum]
MLGKISPEPSVAPAADPLAADQGPDPAPSAPPRAKPESKLCGVCGTQPSKYKCPRCSLPYCSVPCNKQHKENHPPDPPKPEPSATTSPNPSQPQPRDTDPYRVLLDHDQAFAHLFQKYPSLSAELVRIAQTTLPPSDTSNPNPRSRIPVSGYSNNYQRSKTPQPWSRDVGLRRGADALRKARTNPGDLGDGVREYGELVMFLLGKQNTKGDGVVARVREEVVREEVGVIERLLREEEG